MLINSNNRIALAAVGVFVLALSVQPLNRLISHRDDRCYGAITDSQLAQAIGYTDEQVEEYEEKGGDIDRLCTLSADKLSDMRERVYTKELMEYLLAFQKSDDGKVAVDGYGKAIAQREAALAKTAPLRNATIAGVSPGGWTSLGPLGGRTGRLGALAFTPGNPNRMWAGAASGGLFTSTNAGAAWTAVANFPAGLSVSAIVVSATDTNTIWVATGDRDGGVYSGNGIFRSTDGGVNWSRLPATAPTSNNLWRFINTLVVTSGSTPRMLVGGWAGLNYSDDLGTTWVQADGVPFGTTIRDIRIDPNNPNNMIASSSGTIYYSRDGGKTFTATTIGDGEGGRAEFSYAPATPNRVYVSSAEGSGTIYTSNDGGATFAKTSNPQTLGAQGFYGNVLWVDPLNSNNLLSAGVDIWRSSDAGLTFSKITDWANAQNDFAGVENMPHADGHLIVSHPNYSATAKTIYYSSDGGLYRADDFTLANNSVNPATNGWKAVNTGMNIKQFIAVAVSPDGTNVIGGTQDHGTQRVGTLGAVPSGDGVGAEIIGGDGGALAIDQTAPLNVYRTYIYLATDRATDGGAGRSSWTRICTGIADGDKSGCGGDASALFYAPIVLDQKTPTRLLAGGKSLWATDNARADTPTWRAIKTPNAAGSPISAIAIAPSNSDIVWVGHVNGEVWHTSNGTAAAPTWTQVTALTATRRINALTIDAANPARVFVGLAGFNTGNVQLTTDSGTSFTDLSAKLPLAPVYAITRHPSAANWLYVGTEIGLYTSEDGGVTWSTTSDGPGNVIIRDFAWVGSSTTLYVATYGRGMYRTTVGAPVTQVAQSGWWWNPAASGRGIAIEVQPGKLFMASFHYNASGADEWWFSIANSTDGQTYSGTLFKASGGQTLTGAFKSNTSTAIGTVSLNFTSATAGTITWPASIGPAETLTRFPIDGTAVAAPTGRFPETGWYLNAAEPGRGFFVEVQKNTLFMGAFMYQASGAPAWYIALNQMTDATTFQGNLLEYNGGPIPGVAGTKTATQVFSGATTMRFSSPSFAALPDSFTLTPPGGSPIQLVRFRF